MSILDLAPVVALGAGRMGRSIALAYALYGQRSVILDFKQRTSDDYLALEQSIKKELEHSVESLVALGMLPESQKQAVLAKIMVCPVESASTVLQQANLIYEGVPETVEAKRDALERASALAPQHVVIASTTSTMQVEDLAQYVQSPERFLNAHWLNPAFLIPLVEISTHAQTSSNTYLLLEQSLTAVGKVPVKCQGAGFIVPRLQALIMNEAARMVEEGVATAEQIDLATRYGLGFRFSSIGLLEFIDFGGVDILFYANEYLSKNLSAERYECPEIIRNKMEQGQLGLKSGQGFFLYEQDQSQQMRARILSQHFSMLKHVGLAPEYELN